MQKKYGTELSTAILLYNTYLDRFSAIQWRDQVGAITVTYCTVRIAFGRPLELDVWSTT